MKTRFIKEVVAFMALVWLSAQPVRGALYYGTSSGAVGGGTLELNDNGTTISAKFTRAENNSFTGVLVLFIDSNPQQGFTSTASFTDTTDTLTKCISGYDGSSRALANFAPGFTADYAIALTANVSPYGGYLYQLSNGTHEQLRSVNLSPGNDPNSSTPYTFNFKWTDLGLSTPSGFRFQSTYLGEFGYRYLESFEHLSGTAGFNTVNFTDFNVYGTPVPEPANLALGIFAAGFVTVGTVRWAFRLRRKQNAGT